MLPKKRVERLAYRAAAPPPDFVGCPRTPGDTISGNCYLLWRGCDTVWKSHVLYAAPCISHAETSRTGKRRLLCCIHAR